MGVFFLFSMADQSADLVPLVAKYLSSAGLNKTLKALKKEVKLDSDAISESDDLVEIMNSFKEGGNRKRKREVGSSPPSKKQKIKANDDSSSDSSEDSSSSDSSDDSSDSSSDSSEDNKKEANKKDDSSSSSSSSSSSDDSSESSEDDKKKADKKDDSSSDSSDSS